eukprot:CAMPEP_0174378896 /NCGR_PEP_ID=MMETSP0811_2-20130205/122344_1 /TAXON_ID=73025 ORGANISM="Eutreptiella gymnastica-like, Strain CCMP1594" /NCGR_SAMPLE_ID=MMETSP0811_2 /ASSEMBLY_ACC=CAM_ASM_000667 /LENGTH=58 /DNA_ID=CAMNT_0015531253 /DNA_START=109 /DNA_END=285 /DNA_ORIENTATION=-
MGAPAASLAAGWAATWQAWLDSVVEGLARALAALGAGLPGWQGAPSPVASSLPQEHGA